MSAAPGGLLLLLAEALAAAIVGAALGSFVSLLSHRLPRGEAIVGGRSRCPHCGAALRALDLVPVVSWLASGGRCRRCKARVGLRYPAIELGLAALFVLIYLRLGPTWPGLLLAALAVVLAALATIDLETGYLPDAVQAAAVPLGLAYQWAAGEVAWGLAGLVLAGGLAYAVRWGFHRASGRQGLGLGDVKFFAVAGLWLGPGGLPAFLVLAGALGALFAGLWRAMGGEREFPFGPALAAALLAVLLAPEVRDVYL